MVLSDFLNQIHYSGISHPKCEWRRSYCFDSELIKKVMSWYMHALIHCALLLIVNFIRPAPSSSGGCDFPAMVDGNLEMATRWTLAPLKSLWSGPFTTATKRSLREWTLVCPTPSPHRQPRDRTKHGPYHVFGNQIPNVPVQRGEWVTCHTAGKGDRVPFLHCEVRGSQAGRR